LTVTDGSHTAALDFSGSYTLANFKFANDGSGGTIVYDPPVTQGQGSASQAQIAQGPALTALDQQVALFSQQIATAFPSSAFNETGSSVAGLSNVGGAQLAQIAAPSVTQQHV
jgi:hypothetical protein